MNYKMIFRTVGQVLLLEAALLLAPVTVSLIYSEWMGALSLVISAVISAVIGFALWKVFGKCDPAIYARDGLVIVSFAWIAVSLIGALPFVMSGAIPSYIDAFFETVSGFTTTGATILTGEGIEGMAKGLLFWRSFTHWIGGMGVLVFVMALVSRAPDRSMNILRAEMPGPIVDKLVPRARDTAKLLYIMYIGLTVLLVVLLCLGGMPLYEALVHAFGTAGTGGFSVNADSIGVYNHYIQWVIAIFMLIFGVNFNLYYLLILRRVKDFFKSRELWAYLGIFIACVAIVSYSIFPLCENFSEVFRQAFFHVSSVMTTTGYTASDFTSWSAPLAKTVFILLMFIGSCAGSTAGGFKVTRIVILFKKIGNELKRTLHPHTANVVKFEGKRVDDATIEGVGNYLAVYIVSFIVIVLLLSFEKGFSFEANFTAAASCFNNIGPVYGVAGGCFKDHSVFSKIVLSLAMLFGRLEIYPLLLTLNPFTWIKK